MSKGINKVILIGNLGKDPEVRYMPSGGAVANITIATSENWKDKDGKKQEKTEWHRIVMFGKLAELVQNYLKKGSKIYIEGRLQTRKWQDSQGVDRYSTEIVATELEMLSGFDGGRAGDVVTEQSVHDNAKQNCYMTPDGLNEFDDDIPF